MRSPRSLCAAALVLVVLSSTGACTSSGGTRTATPTDSATPTNSATGSGSTGAQSKQVSFTSEGTTAYGTLEIPAHRQGQRLSAALLIPGSGPTDRDGNQAGGIHPDTLKLLSDILTKQGIVTFRFDKYFSGKTGAGKFGADPQTITIQNELRQADAAYDLLATQPEVNPAKLLVVGHSEGGLTALHVATSATTEPAGIALLEPQDGRALDLVRIQLDEQVRALAASGTLTQAQATAGEQALARAVTSFRMNQPVSTEGMAPAVVQLANPLLIQPTQPIYERTWDQIRPVVLATQVKPGTRVLVTDGTRDTNIPPSTIHPLAQALTSAGTTGPGLALVQDIDHDMHLSSQPDTDAVLAPAIVSDVQGWAQPFAAPR